MPLTEMGMMVVSLSPGGLNPGGVIVAKRITLTESADDLMKFHADALFTYDANGRMRRVNEPTGPGGSAPSFYLGRTVSGCIARYRADLPSDLIDELETLWLTEPVSESVSEFPVHHERYLELIDARIGAKPVSAGPVYCVRAENAGSIPPPDSKVAELLPDDTSFLQQWLHDWLDYLSCARPFLVTVSGDAAVSVCCSVRITTKAHEAGVETAPNYRRHGYGVAAVAAWAIAVRSMKRVPLYSTSWENVASQAVARKLAMMPVGVDFSVG